MGERRAILIASSQFPAEPRLTTLRCPENDVEGLSKVLAPEAQGGYREVVPLKNKPHHEVLKTVEIALNRAKKDDFVLIYYSGHGKLDRAGHLCLATTDTEVEALGSTSIPVATILDYIRLSPCRSVGLILDCCYSGAVGESIFRGGVEEQLQQTSRSGGIYILTASTGVQVAEEKESDEYGLLTKHIIQGIESGEADLREDGHISMDELYEYVHGKVTQEGFQEPMKWDLNVTGELVVARNPRPPVVKPAKLPVELQESIEDRRPWVRQGVVPELERLLQGQHKGLALAAYEALLKLKEDDSRAVASAAEKCLTAYEEAQRSKEAAAAREKVEGERRAAEEAERRRVEAEDLRAAERERAAREEAERARLAAERAEAERAARERAEKERLAREEAERKRLAQEKTEADRQAARKAEAERAARDKAEQERLAREEAERARLAAERAAVEHAAREQAEKQRLAREEAESVRLAAERAAGQLVVGEKTEEERWARARVWVLSALAIIILIGVIWYFVPAKEEAGTQYKPGYESVPGLRPGTVRTNPGDGLPYVWIPPGEFQMGCSPGDSECANNEKPHMVRIPRGFWLGQTEVTQAAYQKLMGGQNPSHFKGPDLPVETASWSEAVKYCEAAGGRLPTEAEWEDAVRAGSSGARYGPLGEIAWHDANSGGRTHPVGQKGPNSWGLHDMLGNVWEWVADWYDADYYQTLPSPATDPNGPPSGTLRVLRGGSWVSDPGFVRASFRHRDAPEYRNYNIGFRCAREVMP